MEQSVEKAKKLLIRAGVALLILGGVILFFKWLFLPLLPFMLAWMLSWLSVTVADAISKKTRTPRKPWSAAVLILLFALLTLAVWITLGRLWEELSNFVGEGGELPERLSSLLDRLDGIVGRRFPKLARRIDAQALRAKLSDLIADLAGRASLLLAKAALRVPFAALFIIVTFLSSFYLAIDDRRIKERLLSMLPGETSKKIRSVFAAVKRGVRGYLRAGGYILLLTAVELFVGLSVLGIPFALLLSILTAAIDFLPVLGTGVVLAPMGAFYLIGGDRYRGFGLLILWGITAIVREVVEPRFMGKSLNVHPLFSLFCAYLGLKLFGVPGLALLPVLCGVALSVYRERNEK